MPLFTTPDSFGSPLREFNQCHAPGGAATGGQFCSKGGGTSSPEFKQWFGKSKVVDANGQPLVIYHGTNADPQDFRSGSHFGTVGAANQRYENLRVFSEDVVHRPAGPFQLMPVYLSIKNPLRLPDLASLDDNTGEPYDEALAAFEKKYPTEAERERASDGGDEPHARAWEDSGNESHLIQTLRERDIITRDEFWEHQYDTNLKVFALLERKGYDGIVYENSVEDAGHDSWIIFHAHQVKSATGNRGTFDKRKKRITESNDCHSPGGSPAGGQFCSKGGESDYRGLHTAPDRESGSPAYDLSGTYPDDFYGPKGAEYYGADGGGSARDRASHAIVQGLHGRPNSTVQIYRAVPLGTGGEIARLEKRQAAIMRRGSDDPKEYTRNLLELERLRVLPPDTPLKINRGDWVTINREYAREHGDSQFDGRYKTISKTVKARDIFTNGDSLYEWGYDPAR